MIPSGLVSTSPHKGATNAKSKIIRIMPTNNPAIKPQKAPCM